MAHAHDTIDHQTLLHLVEAGAVRGADVIGQPGGWNIIVKYGMVERTLAARRGAIRLFARFDTLVKYLKSIGIAQCNVNISNYDETVKRVSRPDTKQRLADTKEAVAYDKWFREQVQIGLKEADDPNTVWVSQDEMKATSADRRKKWLAQADRQAA
jgi:hypothetical protein